MASASKTPNLNLPQWVDTEKPERTDFNAAFDALDMAIASAGGGFNTYEYGNEITLTWAQIQAKCIANDFSGIKIGDWKSIVVGSETVIMEVAGICQTTGSDNTFPNIDFISRDCLTTAYAVEADNNVVGGWTKVDLYDTLNGTGGIYDDLPADVKAVIGTKRLLLENKSSSTSDNWAWLSESKLWLPSEIEVYGYMSWSQPGYGSGNFKQYPLFRDSDFHILKGQGHEGAKSDWWMINPVKGTTNQWCAVQATGNSRSAGANGVKPVPICFRVG